jgi:hypothetical protein
MNEKPVLSSSWGHEIKGTYRHKTIKLDSTSSTISTTSTTSSSTTTRLRGLRGVRQLQVFQREAGSVYSEAPLYPRLCYNTRCHACSRAAAYQVNTCSMPSMGQPQTRQLSELSHSSHDQNVPRCCSATLLFPLLDGGQRPSLPYQRLCQCLLIARRQLQLHRRGLLGPKALGLGRR